MTELALVLQVRDRRLKRARREMSEAKAALARANSSAAEAKKAIDDFREQVRTLEIDLLTSLLNTSVTMHELAAVEETLRKTEKRARQLAKEAERQNQARQHALRLAERTESKMQAAQKRFLRCEEMVDSSRIDEQMLKVLREEADNEDLGQLVMKGGASDA
ncbi:hypothetical protein [Ensifer sp. SL37]|uniref:hypothetical protein n=1 Tax=Ensifer sp. SL37 TaxID=2995137 RepID=UPI002275CEF4|nr:hypothetical protein [Ensifer sp. SL37]MCY1740500.1 hypothetical protein [Ensifer sp. SL37]